MNKRFNYAFIAFLAWMATLLTITLLSSCGSANARYSVAYDGGVTKIHNTACAAYQ